MQEIWKDIPGYEEKYQVSNIGRVKSLKRYGRRKNTILKLSNNGSGYLRASLSLLGKRKQYFVSILVAKLFIHNPFNKKEVNHINGIKTNNRVENLEWVTGSENILHAFRTGLIKITKNHHFIANHPNKGKFGADNHKSKKVLQYDLNGNFIKEYNGQWEMQRLYGFNQGNISACCRGVRKTYLGYIWRFK